MSDVKDFAGQEPADFGEYMEADERRAREEMRTTIELHGDFGTGHEPIGMIREDVEVMEGQLTLPCRCTPEQKARIPSADSGLRYVGNLDVCLPCEARSAANSIHAVADKL